MTDEQLDVHLDNILKASGSALKHYSMQKTKDDMRQALREALAQPERDNTYAYASSLATAIWQKHYIKESPKFALLDTTEGVLTQIDNMTCGLVREKPAQPEQEPIKIAHKHEWFSTGEMKTGQIRCISCGKWGEIT